MKKENRNLEKICSKAKLEKGHKAKMYRCKFDNHYCSNPYTKKCIYLFIF